MKKSSRGFTLIELLVVIAIIGILSSVVLASLTSARQKGQAAALQSELSNMRAQAELYYSTTGNNSYNISGSVVSSCATTPSIFAGSQENNLANLIASADNKAALTCHASTTAWSVQAKLDGATDIVCVDSTGKSVSSTTAATLLSGLMCI